MPLVSLAALALLASSPNVLVILTDDQGWGDLSLHDGPGLDTPHLDSIAIDGAQFERFYVSPVCAPTRASLLTGRYHWRTGTHGVTRGQENMRASETTVAELFADVGYATGCFGKWHNGSAYPLDPIGQGFDRFVGFCAGHWNNYFDTTLRDAVRLPDGRVRQNDRSTDGYITDVLTDAAIDFIDARGGRPFLCYVPYNAPHWPPQVPDEYYRRFADRTDLDDKEKSAYAMVENIDHNVGRLLAKLDADGLVEDTIVVFLTDNGANSNRWDGNMREQKGSIHDGGIRVPCFVRYPARIPAGRTVKVVGQHIDLLPTLASLCGVAVPHDLQKTLDGVDLSGVLIGDAADDSIAPRHVITARVGRERPIEGARGSVLSTATLERATVQNGKVKLYDLMTDPSETTDLAKERPDAANQLAGVFRDYVAQFESFEPVRMPIGHAESPATLLQGHEAFLHGSDGREGKPAAGHGISYHGPNGWANDWIDNWTSTEAFPFWTVDVAQPGSYEATLLYRVHPADVGDRVRLVGGEEDVTAELTQARWTAAIDSPDRFPRTETYEQEWASQRLGEIPLAAGPQRIELHLDEIAGERGPQVVGLKLTRKP